MTYQQAVNIVKTEQYILYRTNIRPQHTEEKCGYVDNFCG